jgi:hypothetical protein
MRENWFRAKPAKEELVYSSDPSGKKVNKNCLKQTEKRLIGGGNRASAMWPQMRENRFRGKACKTSVSLVLRSLTVDKKFKLQTARRKRG